MEGGLGFHLPWQVSGSLVPFGISPAVLLTRCSDTSMAAGGCSWGGGRGGISVNLGGLVSL